MESSVPAAQPTPAVLRSRQELVGPGAGADLPITSSGVRYSMAQSLAWLDSGHFAVGRWDGSMSVFEFTASTTEGPLIREAVSSPAFQGVRMVAALPGKSLVSSNDDGSVALWHALGGRWTNLALVGTYAYDPSLGAATSGCAVGANSLVVGHSTGRLSVWAYHPERRRLTFLRVVDLRNPQPVNPWGLHDINAVDVDKATESTRSARVVTGSEDGYVCVVEVPSGDVLSQQVFNPRAQRGINDLGLRDGSLLVANCSVGPSDSNLWYYTLDRKRWTFELRDQANLIIDTGRPQAFNFNTVWGTYSGGPCWFASTEEGALWMGTAGSGIEVIGHRAVTSPLGSALGWTEPGRLAMVAYDPYEFTT
ncbi:hypothetical protein [Streptomyces sp. SID12501]|uniref:WD40 repeat domain-containing protein n=1 Tax=Streptomyces sp. SID12501 TaxID=2706042 RepID=A0A6B3BZQ4_9ACTN|nr:hypothetical protein [Streptomyces sp. SID12501]NEC89620.1 hypothetical protein [Streptomyces sp. SID12501]